MRERLESKLAELRAYQQKVEAELNRLGSEANAIHGAIQTLEELLAETEVPAPLSVVEEEK